MRGTWSVGQLGSWYLLLLLSLVLVMKILGHRDAEGQWTLKTEDQQQQ